MRVVAAIFFSIIGIWIVDLLTKHIRFADPLSTGGLWFNTFIVTLYIIIVFVAFKLVGIGKKKKTTSDFKTDANKKLE